MTEKGIEVVMNALAGTPTVVTADFANEVEQILREKIQIEKENGGNCHESRSKSKIHHVFYQMFPSAACEHLPFAAPSKTFFDLTVLYMLDLDVTAFGGGTCVVSSAMMSELGITAAELDSAVRRNISDCDFKLQKPKPKTIQQNPILANSYIVSCEKHRNAVLLFPEYFQKLANYLQDDLYVLQLSIYHVLVVPAATFTACSVDEIAPILYSALRKFAPKATVLGTSIYKFDRTEGNFSTIIK